MRRGFIVCGSLNIDLTVAVERFPLAGETVSGRDFLRAFGGKGANQAVALSRLERQRTRRDVFMAAMTGCDSGGAEYRNALSSEGIDVSFLDECASPTGTALIEVDSGGQNRIVVVPGANAECTTRWWESVSARYGSFAGTTALFQLEIPIETVSAAITDIHASGGTVILDPAPAAPLPDGLWRAIDFITPNQTEAEFYTGIRPVDDESAMRAGRAFLDRGVHTAILKAGSDGSWLVTAEGGWFCPVFPVSVVDTTAAGDTFNAGFAWAFGAGKPLPEALAFANAAGGLSTTAAGAQGAMPDLDTVEALLQAFPRIGPRRLTARP